MEKKIHYDCIITSIQYLRDGRKCILASDASSLNFVCTKRVQSCVTKVLKSGLWHQLVHNLETNPQETHVWYRTKQHSKRFENRADNETNWAKRERQNLKSESNHVICLLKSQHSTEDFNRNWSFTM